jgi:quinone-modifying oxidoreductase, subunit QmoC
MTRNAKTIDYGWRLRGRPVTELADRSSDLSRPARIRSFLDNYCADVGTLTTCLQCGACTASCGLAEEGNLFPRREVTFVQLGLEARLVTDPAIWHCYGCNDCSARCPSGAKPGNIMAALRHVAIERFAFPRVFARLVNDPRLFWIVYVVAVAAVLALVRGAGTLSPAGPIRFAAMLPHAPLNLFFFGAAALALAAMGMGVRTAALEFARSGPQSIRKKPFGVAFGRAVADVVLHRGFAGCEARRASNLAHKAVLLGCAGLLAVSAAAAIAILAGRPYPFGFAHPAKLAANAFAALLLAGALYGLARRAVDAARGERSAFFDWVFLANLALIGLSGVALEALRASETRGAYAVYFAHLALVLVLVATLPFSKLAHAAYRFTAIVDRHRASAPPTAAELAAREPGPRRPGKAEARRRSLPPRPSDEASVASPENFVRMGHDALAAYGDATLAAAYYKLRDESEPRDGTRYYPNAKLLFGTPFEREKDRREARALVGQEDAPEVQAWYEDAAKRPCTWWLENHLVARHSLRSCMFCGMCTSVCPAAQFYEEYNPRYIVDTALSGDEDRLVALLRSDMLWFCGQCGSCKARCTRENNIMGLVSSLRHLSQLKGYHTSSARGRQQYAARHLWGANFWNRACSLYFRNADAAGHPDFGPRHARYVEEQEAQHARLGGHPDMDGRFAGRKVSPATLRELRRCVHVGGTLFLWNRLEEHAGGQAEALGLGIDEYHEKVRTEG